jgi:protein gp37
MRWDAQAAASGIRARVFCASLADVFDNQVPMRWRDDLWHLIDQTPNLDWLLLTKRPQNIAKMLPVPESGTPPWGDGWPNVWLGTTTENQDEYNRRWPHLAAIRAAVHFISYEPALGPLDIWATGTVPDWVIAGGESGPKARPMHPAWARSLRDQCAAAGVPFHLKQHGEWLGYGAGRLPDEHSNLGLPKAPSAHHEFPDGTVVFRVGKKAAGRLLDGVEHNGFPDSAA